MSKGGGLPVKMITAEECANEAIKSTELRKRLVVIPSWYQPVIFLRRFFPSIVDSYLVKIFAPTPKKKT